MKKLHFYGVEVRGEVSIMHRFGYLSDLNKWIEERDTDKPVADLRYHMPSTTSEVRRVLRRLTADSSLIWPVEID